MSYSYLTLDLFPRYTISDISGQSHRLVWNLDPSNAPVSAILTTVDKRGVDINTVKTYTLSDEGLHPAYDSLMCTTPAEWIAAAQQTFDFVNADREGKLHLTPTTDPTIEQDDGMILAVPWVVTHTGQSGETKCRPTLIWGSAGDQWRPDVHWVGQDVVQKKMPDDYTAMRDVWLSGRSTLVYTGNEHRDGTLNYLRKDLMWRQNDLKAFCKGGSWKAGPSNT